MSKKKAATEPTEPPIEAAEHEEVRYSEALHELESILDQIAHDEVDLDELGGKVQRAASLIKVCRDKIERTEMQVRRIIESLDEARGAQS